MVLFPSDGITTEPHLIYSAEVSATGTIPSSAVLLSFILVPYWSAVFISQNHSITRLISFTKKNT
jgi:hypothetical protein